MSKPHGWIQWKGTDVCMDIHCDCGQMSHVDGDFCYYVKCPHCDKVWECDGHIQLKKPVQARLKEASDYVIVAAI